jgi:acyl-CoA thioesterase-1
VLEAVGIALPADLVLDGVSLVAHLKGGSAPERPLFWHFPHYRGEVTPYSVVRHAGWKLIVRHEGPAVELYDLGADPGETRDVATRHPGRVAELRALLAAHLRTTGARVPVPNAAHVRRPRVLILGDSISIGYTERVRALLGGEAVVVRPMDHRGRPENCGGTTDGLEHLERWLALGGGRWDVIHFNFGLHDLKRVDPETRRPSDDPDDPRQAGPDRYEEQLRRIVGRLHSTGAALVFATTTPVPPGRVRPHRDAGDPARYNAVARRVMAERGVAVDDLYGLVTPRLKELLPRANVHFEAAGYDLLAAAVAEHVRRALAQR